MNTIRPDRLPRFWWAFPWSTARYLHQAATALKEYADRLDTVIELQDRIISDQSAEIKVLKRRNDDMNDAIISGIAITPDAVPHE